MGKLHSMDLRERVVAAIEGGGSTHQAAARFSIGIATSSIPTRRCRLNRDGWRTWEGKPFNLKKVAFIRGAYKLASRYDRLRRRGMLTTREVAAKFGISETAVHEWGRQGLITKCFSDNLNRGLWALPVQQTILKGCGGRGGRPARLVPITAPSSEQGAA